MKWWWGESWRGKGQFVSFFALQGLGVFILGAYWNNQLILDEFDLQPVKVLNQKTDYWYKLTMWNFEVGGEFDCAVNQLTTRI